MIDSNNQCIINDQIMPENKYRDFFRNIHPYTHKKIYHLTKIQTRPIPDIHYY